MRKIIEAVNEKGKLEDELLGKFKDLSASDIKLLKSVDIEEGPKRDGTLWSEDEVMNLVETNDKVLYGALKHLYACQTKDEKEASATRERNNVGFNAFDADFLTSVCKQLITKGSLSPKQKEVSRKKLKKYRKQLVALANS